MKHTEISKTRGCWWKHLLLLWVTILGFAGFASAGNYPFPQNYQYPYGNIYTGTDVQSKIQSLYTAWKTKYYTEGTIGTTACARIKFVQDGESGVNTVSEGIAYGMLIMVYMDNATNNTQDAFNRLYNYYKKNSNSHGVMNWKVNAFTGQVTSGSDNANGATDADLDVAQALLMAHKQWGSTGTINYLTESQTLINNIWNYEVNTNKQLKPGDMFDDYKNPCYFITNAMTLFDKVKSLEGWPNSWNWPAVVSNCYTLMGKVANTSTGLIPDWCYEDGTLLTGLTNSKFESIFGYDAVRIPWRLAQAYAWYGDASAKTMASKITTWAISKYPNPGDIKDGYFLNGTPGNGTTPFTGSLSSWGTSSNACFKAGLSIGSMVDETSTSFDNYMSLCWSNGSATDAYGAYYTHTTQLLFMLCLTGNMPNLWDMLPVATGAETNDNGAVVYVDFSKALNSSSVSASKSYFTIYTYADESLTNPTTISVSSASLLSSDSKRVVLNLSQEIADPYIYVSYSGTSLKGEDNSVASKFEKIEVTNLITSMEPYPTARYTNITGTELYIQWSKELSLSAAAVADFTVYVNGTQVATTPTLTLYSDESGTDNTISTLKWAESILSSASDVITISYKGGTITSSTGTKTAKAFTKSAVQNFYMSVSCLPIYTYPNYTDRVSCSATNKPSDVTYTGSTNTKVMYLKAAAWDRLIYIPATADKSDWDTYVATDGVRLKGRIYVASAGTGDGFAVWMMCPALNNVPNYNGSNAMIVLPKMTVGAWNEFDIVMADNAPNSWQAYNTSVGYTGLWLSTYTGTGETTSGTFEVYIDYLEVCPPDPVVVPTSGKVSYDGTQVEVKFSTAMKVPTNTTAISIKEGTISHTVSSIATKIGDASTLIFTLNDAISSATATVTASLSTQTTDVKSADGRKCETFSLTLANLKGMTTSTGWYDHFNNANDYTTNNLSGDGATGHVTVDGEVAASSLLNVTCDGQNLTSTWEGGVLTLSTAGAGYVMDLTGREEIQFSIKSTKAISGYYRIDVKDIFGNKTDGSYMPFNYSTSYQTVTYKSMNFSGLDKTSISEILFYFTSDAGVAAQGYAPTMVDATLSFDYISVGSALYLYDVTPSTVTSPGIAEGGSFSAKSSVDGYIYVVPGSSENEVAPQFSAMESAVVNGEAVKVQCTAATATTIDLTGLGYGYYKAYAYDPVAGAISAAIGVQILDQTAPIITDSYSDATITSDGTFSITVNENATVYLIPTSVDPTSLTDIISNSYYTINVKGGELVAELMQNIAAISEGDSFSFVAIDQSGNISEVAPLYPITVAQPKLSIVEITPAELNAGESIKVTTSRALCKAYLVSSAETVTLANIATVALSNANVSSFIGSLSTTGASEGYYYIYLVSSDGTELVGPSAKITIHKGTSYVTGLSLDYSAKTINVGDNASFTITFDAADAADQTLDITGMGSWVSVAYDATKNSAGTGTITVTGVSSTAGAAIPLTITANGIKAGDPTVQATISLTVVQKPATVTVKGSATMEMSSTQTLTATVLPDSTDNKAVTWTSSDLSVATVDASGKVTSLSKTGTVTITATSKADATILGTFDIEVTSIAVTGLTLSPSPLSLKTGATSEGAITLTVTPSNATNPGVTFASSKESVATVSYDATTNTITINGIGVGTATITATSANGITSNAVTVTVKCGTDAPTASEVSPSQAYCNGAATATLTATFADPNTEAVWYMYDPSEEEGQTPLYRGNSYEVSVDDLLESYYVTKIENGCEGNIAAKVTPTKTTPPTVAISGLASSYCASSEVITLKSTPSGATFIVDGVAATTLNLATLSVGKHTVVATMGTGTCVGTDTKTVTISAAPAVTITVDDAMCANDAAQTLTASPTGGTWTATGSGAAGLSGSTFSPASGSAVLNYTYVSGPCTVVKTAEVTVTDNPSPIISGLGSTYCSTDAAVTLSASPTGGSFTIDGTVATQFDPSKLSATSHNVVYTVLVNGCSGSATSAVTVNATPSIDLSSVPTTACAGVAVALSPTNGTWSGTYVSGTTFKSDAAGNYELTYSDSTVAGCAASDAITIAVLKATVPTVAPITVELNAVVPALSATATGTITWYADATTTTSLETGATYTPEVSTATEATYTYYVSNTVEECESARTPVTLTVTGCTTAAPSIAEVAAICEGEDFPTLTASGVSGATFTWYDAITGGKTLGTSATYVPTTAGTYYASQTVGCEGPRANVVVEVKETPSAPTAIGASSCSGAALVAMSTTESSNWYASKTGLALAEGVKTYTPSGITATTTFYVNQVVNGCTSDFSEVTYTVKATPDAPTVTATEACLGSTGNYIVKATAKSGATLQWYDGNSSPKGTAATQVVSGVTTAKDYTYTVTQTISGCTSLPASATLTVDSLPVPTITNALTYCSNSAATVSLTADLPGGEFKIDGIVATSFVPQILGVGTYQVTYTYTDANSCVGQATPQTIAIEDCSDPAITNITVAPTTLTLTVGDASYQLTKSLTPSTGTSNQEVTWISSDSKVATVDNTGKVTAVGKGTATITVSSAYTAGKSDECLVTVNEAIVPITAASFKTGTPSSVAEGGSLDFSSFVTINPAEASSPVIVWSVEGSTATTISTAGKLTAETGLTADKTITVKATITAGGVTKVASQQVTILKGVVPVNKITVICPAFMEQNKNYAAEATVEPAGADDKTFTWSIDGSGATIDNSGNITVTGAAGSTFNVIATANDASGVTGSAKVTIIAESIPVESVTFNSNPYSIYASEKLDLSNLITVSPTDATIQSTVWTITQGSTYATVSNAGVFTGITGAVSIDKTVTVKVTVTTTDGTIKSASQTITVKKDLILVKEIVIDNSLTMEAGTSKTMSIKSITSNADNKTVAWSIKSGSGATIVAGTGEITVTGNPGDSFVVVATATDAGGVVSNKCVVSVVAQTIAVTKIVPSLTTVEVQAGDVVGKTITVSYQPSNTTQQGITVYANTSVFSYTKNANGSITITGIQGGSATLTIRSDVNPNVLAEVTVNVTELVKNITINGPQSMLVGGVSQLSAVVGETTATNKTVSWTSSDPLIATVSSTGLVTALKGGLVTITATANDGSGVSSVSNIYISTIPVQTITASNVTLEIGSSATIKATIAPTNATYKTLTYVPADNSIISVDASGNISTIAEGSTTVTITAPQDGVSTTITVTVTPVKADKEYLIRLIDDEVWGAYAVYQKVQDSTIIIGFGKGRISPIVYNEFIQAWTEAQTVRYEDYATQGKVDSAATNLYNAIVAMGEKPTAIGEVSTIEAKVYPTKVTDHVTIEANDLISVKVVSATGKIVAQEEAFGDNWEINTSTYAQGVYKVVIETADGVIVKGFIK